MNEEKGIRELMDNSAQNNQVERPMVIDVKNIKTPLDKSAFSPVDAESTNTANQQKVDITPKISISHIDLDSKRKKKILKIAALTIFILSLAANGVLGYMLLQKLKTIKSQQTTIDNKSYCPACPPAVECPAAATPEPTPEPTPTPTSTKKSTPSSSQEEVLLPPPPPSD